MSDYPYKEYDTKEIEDKDEIEKIKKVVKDNDTEDCHIGVDGVGEIKKNGYLCHQIYLSGGLNGPGDWKDYFKSLSNIVRGLEEEFKDKIEVISLKEMWNDQPDDVFYLVLDMVLSFEEEE